MCHHASREHYFLFPCHSLTCGWKGQVFFCLPMSATRTKCTFRCIVLRQFRSWRPLPYMCRGPLLTLCILGQRSKTIYGHASVSAVCQQDKTLFVQTCFWCPSAQPVEHSNQTLTYSTGLFKKTKHSRQFPVPIHAFEQSQPVFQKKLMKSKLKFQTVVEDMLFCVGKQVALMFFCFSFFFAVVTTVSLLCNTICALLIKRKIYINTGQGGNKGHSRKFSLLSWQSSHTLLKLSSLREAERRNGDEGVFWSSLGNRCSSHAPGVPACWSMRGSPPPWTGVVSCSAVITMVFSSMSSQVGLEKAERGRVILCISRSYARCSCCFFNDRPLTTKHKKQLWWYLETEKGRKIRTSTVLSLHRKTLMYSIGLPCNQRSRAQLSSGRKRTNFFYDQKCVSVVYIWI